MASQESIRKKARKVGVSVVIVYLLLQGMLAAFWVNVERNDDKELECVVRQENIICFPWQWRVLLAINIVPTVLMGLFGAWKRTMNLSVYLVAVTAISTLVYYGLANILARWWCRK